ncbi:uroporphyrinogen-III synthase [Neptunomonas antarctica]|uniref:Uroporphyrinogen-III synthase n=1 Tax=Neptunomonas antarctica TaxID=619304 RepID=A0A1N7MKB0_9GAMM|nr:uroporphyrinogen-III synthase [Neptunomonas antarctica]SIS86460.1 uroporphyrinogen-III synthase [Neptunomonas antarctica]
MHSTSANLPDLQGQRILVTRPQHQATQQIQLLESCGAQALHLPALEIRPIAEEDSRYAALRSQIMNLDMYGIIICISPNAAHFAIDWIDQYWPQLPEGIQWYAIGHKTSQVLNDYDIPATYSTAGFDSEAMLTMPDLQGIKDKKILILRGTGGRNELADTLSARGAEVEYANLYDRTCPKYDDTHIKSTIYNFPLSSILITSGEALNNFVTVAQGSQQQFSTDSLHSICLVVPSERIAAQARQVGFSRITVAQGPDDLSMVTALNSANDSEADE